MIVTKGGEKMSIIDEHETDELGKLVLRYRKELYKYPNVRRVAVGHIVKNGKVTDEIGLVVGVSEKLPIAMLSEEERLPDKIEGIAVDVQRTGEHRKLNIPLVSQAVQLPDYDCSWRDVMQGGVGLAHYKVTGGTLGTVDTFHSTDLGVTNNHVGANQNDAQIGDPIMQPSPYCQVQNRTVATLFAFKPLIFVGGTSGCNVSNVIAAILNGISSVVQRKTRFQAVLGADPFQTMNNVDLSFLQFVQGQQYAFEHLKIGMPNGNRRAVLDEIAAKRGARTDVTHLICTGVHATVGPVSYGDTKIAYFEDQDIWAAYQDPYGSGGGDSGSVLLGLNDLARLDLLFAGSDVDTITSPYEYVVANAP
jgi:hypothetical protein